MDNFIFCAASSSVNVQIRERAVRYYLMIEHKIGNNIELIEEILESAENSGQPMTLAAFEKWLDRASSQAGAIGVEAVRLFPSAKPY